MTQPSHFPVDDVLPQLIAALSNHHAAVLQAPTGSGKTTRVPPALADSHLLGDGKLILLQPRRVAARACAQTMADWAGQPLGRRIGYQVRFERRFSQDTRILVVTEGILTRRLMDDPMLEDVTCVVLDEFHERSLHADLALACLAELAQLRDDLKIVVMSATLDAAPVAQFLGQAPVLNVTTRTHPLTVSYLTPQLNAHPGEAVAAALQQLLNDPQDDGGHILAFLPGAPEIRRVQRFLAERTLPLDVIPLHGSLAPAEQDTALAPASRRRLILATNIAETSLTIPGVTAVIDSGLRKVLFHDAQRGFDRLDTVQISRASADQRAGRAGRTGPGRAIRLWSETRHHLMAARDDAEIQTADLTSLMLCVLDFHGPNLADFPFYETPPEPARIAALRTLHLLGAVSANHRLTDKGRRLAKLPLHPRQGAILEQAAALNCRDAGATLCAILGERPLSPNLNTPREALALLDRIRHTNRAALPPEVDSRAARRVQQAEQQLQQAAARLWPQARTDATLTEDRLGRLLLAGYPDRLCRARTEDQGVMVGGRGVVVSTRLKPGDLFLALNLMERGHDRTASRADQIVPIALDTVRDVLQPTQAVEAVFDEAREAVTSLDRLRLGDLILQEKPAPAPDPQTSAEVLAAAAAERFERCFKPDKAAASLLYRLRFAAAHTADPNWPDFSDVGIKAMLPEICYGKRKLRELEKLNWVEVLTNALTWPQRQELEALAPERFQVPSGSRIAIDYEPAFTDTGHPVLAVRLQEMFGQERTPMVGGGKVAVLCYLLGPNMRPVQMTRDLENFWSTTYAEVRKELRQRYPKHYWPEDPRQAQAIRGVRPRKT